MRFDGKRLEDIRAATGITQDGLAKRLGVNRVSVSQWESGKHEPSIETIGKIGAVFNLKGSFFLTEVELP